MQKVIRDYEPPPLRLFAIYFCSLSCVIVSGYSGHSVATAEMSYRKFPQKPLFDQAEFMQRYDIRNWQLFVQACEAYSALMS